MTSHLPIIAIIGRPNVGKSSLFNRLTEKKLAIVHDTPGLTRDRQEHRVTIGEVSFLLVDTPGLDDKKNNPLADEMNAQTTKAAEMADIIFFTVDGHAGVSEKDKYYAKWLRKFNKKIALIINKSENFERIQEKLHEFARLGFEDKIAVSAAHNFGVAEIYRYLKENLASSTKAADEEADLRLAIVGRPNVGKSTIINKLINEDRLLVGSTAGLTRDAISIDYKFKDKKIKLFDTAGIRKKKNIHNQVEQFSVEESIEAINFANICALVLDATSPLEKQDLTIAERIIEEGRGLVLVFNKIDLISNLDAYKKDIDEVLQKLIPDLRHIATVYVSALEKMNLAGIISEALRVAKGWRMEISTKKLNDWLHEAQSQLQIPLNSQNKRPRLKFISQIKSKPPYFIIFGNFPNDVPLSYQRYLANSLRETFKIESCPVRLHFRKSDNPYSSKE
jgi:GTP-binding protein